MQPNLSDVWAERTATGKRAAPSRYADRASGWLTGIAALAIGAAAVLHWPAPIRIVDGDTVDRRGLRYRLVGFDAPEIRRAKCPSERAAGRAAAARLAQVIASAETVQLVPVRLRLDVFGRILARLEVDGRDVAAIAIAEGWGVPHDGRSKRRDWCTE
jgi:endonuclease YncB( thermonuclease family)